MLPRTDSEPQPNDGENLRDAENSLLSNDRSDVNDDNIDDIEVAFAYSKINTCKQNGKQIHCQRYYAYYEPKCSGEFIFLDDKSKERQLMGDKEKGLKFHISLANIENNIEKGWNIVKNLLVIYKVSSSKVIRDMNRDHLMVDRSQSGKEITIYAFKDTRNVLAWEELLQALTMELAINKIIPGPLPPSNTEINGSNYVSYHCFTDSIHYNNPVNISDDEAHSDDSSNNEVKPETSVKRQSPEEIISGENLTSQQLYELLVKKYQSENDKTEKSVSLYPSEVSSEGKSSGGSEIHDLISQIEIHVENQMERFSFDKLLALKSSVSVTSSNRNSFQYRSNLETDTKTTQDEKNYAQKPGDFSKQS